MTPSAPSPLLLNRLRRGVNAENIGGGRCVSYAPDTWKVLDHHGFSHARLPIAMDHVLPGAVAPAVVAATLARLDATVAAVARMGWAVSLCPFGDGALPDVDVIDQTLAVLAPRYAPMVGAHRLMFELRNEPHQFTPGEWNAAVPRLVATIRAHAPRHTIVVPPVLHASCEMLASLKLLDDPNVVYTVHFYEPAALTQQGQNGTPIVPDYPFPAPDGTPGSTGLYTAAKLAARVKIAADWAALHKVPVMFGEFGCASDAPAAERLAWAAAMVALIESHPEIAGWSWWGVDGRKFGLRPHQLAGAWDQPLLDALTGAMAPIPGAA